MENALSLLEASGLSQWSDQRILAGTKWSPEIRSQMDNADILVFLVSRDFLASEACKDEWIYAKSLAEERRRIFIPIVLRPCAWEDYDTMRDHLALPNDGNAISKFPDEDEAWQQVYLGIKGVLEDLLSVPRVKDQFAHEAFGVDFISQAQTDIRLSDIFEFPNLRTYSSPDAGGKQVASLSALLDVPRVIVHGDVLSGKTALCGHVFEHLAGLSIPALYINFEQHANRPPSLNAYREIFESQATGSFDRWLKSSPLVILDGLSGSGRSKAHLRFCAEQFSRTIATMSSDVYYSYYTGESAIAQYTPSEIMPLTHVKQEQIVRRWLDLSGPASVSDGEIDRLEAEINSVIVDNRILPRYPYYVLTILQAREGFMPKGINLTAYGHCHYALILAHLIKAGIDREDSEINSCFNFASEFAFFLFDNGLDWRARLSDDEMEVFLDEYTDQFLVESRTLDRLQHPQFGIIRENRFKGSYMYYYFLGKYLSDHEDVSRVCDIVEGMAEECYVTDNSFALMSLVHHSGNARVIDDLVVRNLCSLEHIVPATLRPDETEAIRAHIDALPAEIMQEKSVGEAREKQREARDVVENEAPEITEGSVDEGRMISTES